MDRIQKISSQVKNGLFQMPKDVGIPVIAGALLSISLAGTVLAEGEFKPDFKKRIYINGGIGLTHVEPVSPSDSLTVSDNADTGAHLALGYDINRFLSVEGYAADLGAAQIAFLGADVGSIDYQVFGISALGYLFNNRSGAVLSDDDLDGLFRREGLSLYGRLGIGKMQNSAQGVEYYQDYSTHASYGLGLEYGFTNGFALRTEIMAMDTDAKYLNVGVLKRFGKVRNAAATAALAIPAALVAEPTPVVTEVAVSAPQPAPPAIGTPTGNFAFDRSVITPKFARDLDALASVLIKNDVGIYISGHADWIGSEEYNMGLSERRASGVENYLRMQGVDAQLLESRGYGETRPIADNTTERGRAMNRRVEIDIQ